MWTRKPTAPVSDDPVLRALGRRGFLRGLVGFVGWLAAPLASGPARARASLPAETTALLETSPFVYVSPLRADKSESTCHGEVWFGWLDGAVVINTARTTWKARSQSRGLDRARLWVGDHGRWKRLLVPNEAFREAPHFDARASVSRDAELLERLMRLYDRKYPEEFPKWEQRMREGFASGERLLLRYEPL